MKKTTSSIVENNLFKKKYSSPLSDKEVMISQNYFINQININNLKNKIEESILNQREKSVYNEQNTNNVTNVNNSGKSKRDSFENVGNNSTVSQYSNQHAKRGIKSAKPDLIKAAISPQNKDTGSLGNMLTSHHKRENSKSRPNSCNKDKLNSLFGKIVGIGKETTSGHKSRNSGTGSLLHKSHSRKEINYHTNSNNQLAYPKSSKPSYNSYRKSTSKGSKGLASNYKDMNTAGYSRMNI